MSISPEIKQRLQSCLGSVPADILHVSIERQELTVIKENIERTAYKASTSQYGVGNRDGSNQTPAGIHRIVEKIGEGVPAGTIFRDRIDTKEIWDGNQDTGNLILTRILRLEGCEDGINRGNGIDSFERYIYIHGTNKENNVGTPLSHGCVVMRSSDIIELFNTVKEGTIVVID